MLRLSQIVWLLLFPLSLLRSQTLPIENATLNYRIIGFSFPANGNSLSNKLEIALGHFNSLDSFKKNIIKTISSGKNNVIIELPYFGKHYSWRYSFTGKKSNTGQLHHFTIGDLPCADTNNRTRLRIIKSAEKYKDAFVFCDGDRTLYNMEGKPVWYLPNVAESYGRGIRDLKISPKGTITFEIDEYGAYETDYNGQIIWKAPNNGIVSGDSIEHYHHEFTRLNNGHYLALAQQFCYWKQPVRPGDSLLILEKEQIKHADPSATYVPTPMGTLIEYDQKGDVLWSWKSSAYLNESNFFHERTKDRTMVMHGHENSFFFDEKHKAIYLNFRNQNSIIKIKYPEGNLLRIYHGTNDALNSNPAEALFCGQHSCSITQEGQVCLFNNNTCSESAPPSIILLKEPVDEKGQLQKIWEYKFTVQNKGLFASGGNVTELADRSLFISSGLPDSKLILLSKNKQILWEGVFEKWNPISRIWEPATLYRASIIQSRSTLEKLVWNQVKCSQNAQR